MKYFKEKLKEVEDLRFGKEPSTLDKILMSVLKIRKAIRDTQPDYYIGFNL